MKKYVGLGLVVATMHSSPVSALPIEVFDWAFNIDGIISEASNFDPLPLITNLDADGFGTLSWSTSVAGFHSIIGFFDTEFAMDGIYWNEYADVFGSPSAGQSWEIDEPLFFGDIYDNVVVYSALDNRNEVPIGLEEDVSLALGWEFSLEAGQYAEVDFLLSNIAPQSGFYLGHFDDGVIGDSSDDLALFLSSSLSIQSLPVPVPEPTTLAIFGMGLAGLLANRKRLIAS